MKVFAPDLVERKSPYKNKRRDQYLRDFREVDPHILAGELGTSVWFVKLRQRQLGIRKCVSANRSSIFLSRGYTRLRE